MAFQATITQIGKVESKNVRLTPFSTDFMSFTSFKSQQMDYTSHMEITSKKENFTDILKRDKITNNDNQFFDMKDSVVLYSCILLAVISGFGAIFEVWRQIFLQNKIGNKKREADNWYGFSTERKSSVSTDAEKVTVNRCKSLPEPVSQMETTVRAERRSSI